MNMRQFLNVAVAAGGVLVAVAEVSSAAPFGNGDFSANASSYTQNLGYNSTATNPSSNPSNPTDWFVSGGYNGGVNGSDAISVYNQPNDIFGPATVPSPGDYGFLQNYQNYAYTSYYQTFSVTAGTYSISYQDAARPKDTESPTDLLYVENGPFSALGLTISTTPGVLPAPTGNYLAYQAEQPSNQSFTTEPTLTFTISPGETQATIVLENTFLTGYGNSGQDETVDFTNISITQVTPEPTSLALLTIGSLGMLARRRRAAIDMPHRQNISRN
jgi:hypothetical protein